MNDDTPTTDEVRTAFGNYFREEPCCDEHALWDYHGGFDRWLFEITEDAYDKGYADGLSDGKEIK